MDKEERRILNKVIRDILQAEEVTDQKQILEKLEEVGFRVTQSSLSRYLHRLGVKKEAGVYCLAKDFRQVTYGLVKKLSIAPPNLLIVHTLPAYANALASLLDEYILHVHLRECEVFEKILGTIAGDDTVFIAAANLGDLKAIERAIKKHFGIRKI